MPRAVGYSAGIVEHFFRGRIDAQWRNAGGGAYDLTIWNRSTDHLGADATIEAVYRADPSHFPYGNSNDTGLVVAKTPLSTIPSFTGLAPGAGASLRVFPQYLEAGQSLLDFERRIVVRGTLGTEKDAVLTFVEPPRLRIQRIIRFEEFIPAGAQLLTISPVASVLQHPTSGRSSTPRAALSPWDAPASPTNQRST